MTDYIGYMVQGLFVGIGAGLAGYFNERHIKTKLERIEKNVKKIINGVK